MEEKSTLTLIGAAPHKNLGTLLNNGRIALGNTFLNTGLIDTGDPDSEWAFIGAGFTKFAPGTATISQLSVEKQGTDVDITGDMVVERFLDFSKATDSRIFLGDNDLILGLPGRVTGANDTRHILTDGDGYLIKRLNSDQSVLFPIGDEDGYAPFTAQVGGNSYGNASIRVRTDQRFAPDTPTDATDRLRRTWTVEATGISNYRNAAIGGYNDFDVTGQEDLILGASQSSGEWSYAGASRRPNTVMGIITANDALFTGTNFYGRAKPEVYLQGAYNSGAGNMNTTLRNLGLIPADAPYADAPATATNIPTDAVDWVKVEMHDPDDPFLVMDRKSGFLLSDGRIVGPDGSSPITFKDALPKGYLSVHHRNHLPVRTADPIDLSTAPIVDLRDPADVYTNPTVTSNGPLKQLPGGAFGMWSGDVNGDGRIAYNGGSNDRIPILINVGFTTPNNTVSGYFREDVNLNGTVSYNGGLNDRIPLLINVGFLTSNNVISAHNN